MDRVVIGGTLHPLTMDMFVCRTLEYSLTPKAHRRTEIRGAARNAKRTNFTHIA